MGVESSCSLVWFGVESGRPGLGVPGPRDLCAAQGLVHGTGACARQPPLAVR